MPLVEHIFRRGLSAAHGMHGMMSDSDQGGEKPIPPSPIATLVFFLTALVPIILIFSVSLHPSLLYSYWPGNADCRFLSIDWLHIRSCHSDSVYD